HSTVRGDAGVRGTRAEVAPAHGTAGERGGGRGTGDASSRARGGRGAHAVLLRSGRRPRRLLQPSDRSALVRRACDARGPRVAVPRSGGAPSAGSGRGGSEPEVDRLPPVLGVDDVLLHLGQDLLHRLVIEPR